MADTIVTNDSDTIKETATMAYTPGYALPLPAESDNYDVEIVNEVTEKVDAALSMLKENIEKRTDPLAQTVGETILSSVLQYPNYTLGYRGTKAPDAPPSYGSYWAKITSIGGSISFGLTVYLILNSSTRTFVRTILNGAWVEHEWQEVVSPSIAQRTAALESAMLAVLGDGNNV